MPAPSRAEIFERLRELPERQLRRARDFLAFLAGACGATEPPEPPPVGASDPYLDLSLGMLMRIGFGPVELPAGEEPQAGPVPYKRLEVPLQAQEQSLWCWAGTAQMIMAYHKVSVRQLDLAKKVVRDPLPGIEGARRFNRGGWPPFRQWAFERRLRSGRSPLSQEDVLKEIDAGRPFAVSWRYRDGGGHMLVIVGYLWIGDELWLVANDPWPPGESGGDRSLISYDHYVGGLAGAWRTYFEIRPTSGAQGARS